MKLFETEQDERIAELEILLMDVKTDLLMRAEKDSQGASIVNLSGSIWHRVKDAIESIQFRKERLDDGKRRT